MTTTRKKAAGYTALLAAGCLLLAGSAFAGAEIEGITGPVFNLRAKDGYITAGDGFYVYTWGYANSSGGSVMQYPGPTLIVNQGQVITVRLTNELDVPTSLLFPGHRVTATGGTGGVFTREAQPGATVVYRFQAREAGTYHYHSGTRPELQVEMGLIGALIVRPVGYDPQAPLAYGHPDAAYDHEYLFLLTAMDPRIHEVVDFLGVAALADTDYLTHYVPNYWFINGRNAPDVFAPAFAPWLPHQPYDCVPRTHPGEKLLIRLIGGSRDIHPFHTHGNHAQVIAQDGRLLKSLAATGLNQSHDVFTVQTVPGQTTDAIWSWTGDRLGWDAYGHAPGDPLEPFEYAPDHGKELPVTLPEQQNLFFGGFYSGSPFLGSSAFLPPGEGGLNFNGGFHFMWHSHTESELVNFDVFPGGMLTMCIVEPWSAPIP